MKRLFQSLLTAIVLVGFTAVAQAEKPKVALIMKTLSNEYFIAMKDGADKAAKEQNIDLIVQVAEKENSTEELVSLVENMIASKIDAIVVTPNDSHAFVSVFKDAEKAGIPIIDLDVELDKTSAQSAGLTYYYVGVNNFDGGYKSAKRLVDELGGKGKVVILEGIPGVDNGEQRKAGAMKAFSEAPGIEVVASQTANWETEQALNVMTNILTANPDINGVFAANDNMAIGAITAIENAGMEGKILVSGYDALPLALQYIKEGKMLNTIDQGPAAQAAKGLEFAVKRINKEEVPERFYQDLIVIDKSNVK